MCLWPSGPEGQRVALKGGQKLCKRVGDRGQILARMRERGDVTKRSTAMQEDKALFDIIWVAGLLKSCFSGLLPTRLWQFCSLRTGVCVVIPYSWQWKPHCFSSAVEPATFLHV